MTDDRNLTIHTYHEEVADKIFHNMRLSKSIPGMLTISEASAFIIDTLDSTPFKRTFSPSHLHASVFFSIAVIFAPDAAAGTTNGPTPQNGIITFSERRTCVATLFLSNPRRLLKNTSFRSSRYSKPNSLCSVTVSEPSSLSNPQPFFHHPV